MTREELLELARNLEITDAEAGEPHWQHYLSDAELARAINDMRPDAGAVADET